MPDRLKAGQIPKKPKSISIEEPLWFAYIFYCDTKYLNINPSKDIRDYIMKRVRWCLRQGFPLPEDPKTSGFHVLLGINTKPTKELQKLLREKIKL